MAAVESMSVLLGGHFVSCVICALPLLGVHRKLEGVVPLALPLPLFAISIEFVHVNVFIHMFIRMGIRRFTTVCLQVKRNSTRHWMSAEETALRDTKHMESDGFERSRNSARLARWPP